MNTERTAYVDYAKGIGIISVVCFHVIVGVDAARLGLSDFLKWTVFLVDSFQMPLFFLLAGLHSTKSLEDRATVSFVGDKLSRLIYPYIIWSLITGGSQIVLSRYVNSSITAMDLLSIIYRPLPNQHYWFVAVLFLMFMIFLIAFRISSKYYLAMLVAVAMAPLIFNLHSSERVIDKLYMNMLFFVLGIIYTQYGWDRYLRDVSVKALFAIVAIFLFSNFLVWQAIPKSSTAVRLIIGPLGIGIVIMVSKYFAALGRYDFLRQFGIYSMQIYLSHVIFLASLRIFLQKILGITNVWIHIPLEIAAALFFPIILYKLAIGCRIPYLFEIPRKKSIPVNTSEKHIAASGL